MSLKHALPLSLVGLFAAASSFAAPNPPLPGLPGANGAPGPAPAASADLEQVRKGVVQVEQGGRPLAVGTVLSKDGRILTSLSALGATEQPEIRYSDNSVVKAKIGHKDKGWDLALLIPQSGKWLDGLMPTDADPTGQEIKAFLPKGGKLSGVGVALKGRTDARTKEGDPLRSVLDLDFKGTPAVPGAPLFDPSGKVVGVLVRACKDTPVADKDKTDGKTPPCTPITVGAPVTVVRSFLMKTPSTAIAPAPWLGLGGVPTDAGNVKGIRVMGVRAGSPAEKAGLKATPENPDTIVEVDGQAVETPEQLADVIAKRGVGQTVKLRVLNQGKYRDLAVALRAAP